MEMMLPHRHLGFGGASLWIKHRASVIYTANGAHYMLTKANNFLNMIMKK